MADKLKIAEHLNVFVDVFVYFLLISVSCYLKKGYFHLCTTSDCVSYIELHWKHMFTCEKFVWGKDSRRCYLFSHFDAILLKTTDSKKIGFFLYMWSLFLFSFLFLFLVHIFISFEGVRSLTKEIYEKQEKIS